MGAKQYSNERERITRQDCWLDQRFIMSGQRRGKRRGGKTAHKKGDATHRPSLPRNSTPLAVTIGHIGGRGDGVATAEVKLADQWEPREETFFIPHTLAGEKVLIRPLQRRGGGVASELLELVTPAAERQAASCEHFMECGGCQLQHLQPTAYEAWKLAQLTQHLARAGLADCPRRRLISAAPGQRRRLILSARRLANGVVLGFHQPASNHIIAVHECPVASINLQALLPGFRSAFESLLAPGASGRLHLTECDNGIDCLIGTPTSPSLAAREVLTDLATTADLARISWQPLDETGDQRPAETVLERRRPLVRFGKVNQTPPPGSFLQATLTGQIAIIDAVLEAALGAKRIIDLYAGCGTLTLPAATIAPVHAVDGARQATNALSAASHANGPRRGMHQISVENRDLDRQPLLAGELAAYDTAIVDPPRSGARAQVTELAKANVCRVAMVSCNPATFSRDAQELLDAGFQCQWIQPIDQFLWSPHLELVAAFTRT